MPPMSKGEPAGRVLLVDDEEQNLELFEALLAEDGYDITTAADGEAALAAVELARPDAIVLDVMMPRLDGFGTLARLKAKKRTAGIPVILATALSGVAERARGLAAGADDFLTKPVSEVELRSRVRTLVRLSRLARELDGAESIVIALQGLLESKVKGGAGHGQRVAARALRLAHHLALWPVEIEVVGRAAMLHDLGKLGLSDSVLAAGNLDPAFREHTELAEEILAPLRSFAVVRDVIRHHHERLDGSGFPDALSGSELSLPVEIVALANFHDELHRSGASRADATSRLRFAAMAGEFHRDLVEDFVAHGLEAEGEALPAWDDLLPVPQAPASGRILLVHDARAREALREMLEGGSHHVTVTETVRGAAELAAGTRFDLVILDGRLSGDGASACRELKSLDATRRLPLLVLVPAEDLLASTGGDRHGADDVLALPVQRPELTTRVRSLLRLTARLRGVEEHQAVILSLASAVEARDPSTRGHAERTGLLAQNVGFALGLSEAECEDLRVAGLLHDLGEVAVPESILKKSGPLSASEWAILREHPVRSAEVLAPLTSLARTLPAIRHHHERMDGRGFPAGLSGEAVPLSARILGLTAAFDALTSERSYRRALSTREALSLLTRETNAGLWDPAVTAALVSVLRKDGSFRE